jgi:predicted lipoprotein with Yx(FWY)xxD motif
MRQLETRAPGHGEQPNRNSPQLATAVRRLALLFGLTLLPAALFAAPAAAVIAPVVQNSAPATVSGGVELRGKIYTYENDTHYRFEYGTTTAYGTSAPVPDGDAGVQPIATVAQTISGLAPNTVYHYRLVASNEGGTGESPDATFNSSEVSAPAQPAPGAAGEGAQGGGGGGEAALPKGGKLKLKIERVAGKRVLAAPNGHTLYSLSVEKKGKFVCTQSSGCLALWKPLLVPNSGSVVAPMKLKLGSIKRPEGGRQVTYRGRPLYTFGEDHGPGKANGEGFKDVGTWHAVAVPKPKHKRARRIS